ncbi:signal transducer [Mycena polygramma]|nr:signal transducer [Mycena polygramma]
MGDTPVPSPKVDVFAPRVLPAAPSAPSQAGHSQFLDLDEDEADDEDSERADEEEQEVDEEDVPEPAVPPTQPLHTSRRAPPAAASDFPLPPPTQQQFMQPGETYVNSQTLLQPQRPQQQQQQYAQSSEMALQPQRSQQYAQSSESLNPQAPLQPQRLSPIPGTGTVPASFRALPLISTDLPHTTVNVSHSFVRPNDRGKEVLSFVVFVDPGGNKEGWKVEKMYSDVLALDQRVRNSVGKGVGKKMVSLPEGKLWKDHAPAKVDQRKAILETYLQALVNLPVKNNDEVIAFFTSDIVREYKQAVMQAGHKEGYLTKRGKNFGGWKTRFFVLQGPVLEYYDCRGGAHLGSITVTGAQIGRQQRSERPATDEEKEYRHAFLIVEAKKGPGGNHPRHVLCAESDADRDSWVEILVRYFSGVYSEEPVSYGAPQPTSNPYPNGGPPQSRPSTDTYAGRSSSPTRSLDYSPIDRNPPNNGFNDSQARRVMEQQQQQQQQQQRPQPSSLPDSSPLATAAAAPFPPEGAYQRASSEQGYYPDMQNGTPRRRQHSPEQHRQREGPAKGFQPTLNTPAAPPDRAPSPEKPESKVKISGPMGGAPIPAGYKFGGKDAPPPDNAAAAAANERREKAKSRSFWGFGRQGGAEKTPPAATFIPRAVFGVTLEESLDVAQIANLPAIVFRCIQYLEAKKADQEEGIYRLSGSSAVIKSLKDRFNMEGDIDLVGSDEYWDPHAIAGLLKSFLRELPASILTHNLHLRFLAVIDFVDPQERIRELSQLIAALPIANYSLLRALTAHLILIVQNSTVNKMTMRNVGIVFSPTLGIPAGVFSLMLGEFNRVFNVDADNSEEPGEDEQDAAAKEAADPDLLGTSDRSSDTHRRRNSRQYSSGAADQLLGLSGRSLTAAEEGPSDDDSVQYESETTEDNVTIESSNSSPGPGSSAHHDQSPPPEAPKPSTKAASTASTKGLNVSVSSRGNRYSTMMGLPTSPRPPLSPRAPPDAVAPV